MTLALDGLYFISKQCFTTTLAGQLSDPPGLVTLTLVVVSRILVLSEKQASLLTTLPPSPSSILLIQLIIPVASRWLIFAHT